MSPTLRQLEYFVSVATHGSFHAAAKACGVSQPGLSGQIQQLETQLDVPLFDRDRRNVRLTQAGEKLLPLAKEVLSSTRTLVESAASLGGPLVGRLQLGAIPTIAPYLLPQVLPEIQLRFPELRLELTESRTDDLLELLDRGAIDVAVLAFEAELGSVATMELFRDDFSAVVPSAHDLAKSSSIQESELSGAPVLLLDDGHCLRDQVWSVCESAGAESAGGFRASSLATVCQMVASGVGLTLVPGIALRREAEIDGVTVVPFGTPRPFRTIGLAWRANSSRADEFREFGQLIIELRALH